MKGEEKKKVIKEKEATQRQKRKKCQKTESTNDSKLSPVPLTLSSIL